MTRDQNRLELLLLIALSAASVAAVTGLACPDFWPLAGSYTTGSVFAAWVCNSSNPWVTKARKSWVGAIGLLFVLAPQIMLADWVTTKASEMVFFGVLFLTSLTWADLSKDHRYVFVGMLLGPVMLVLLVITWAKMGGSAFPGLDWLIPLVVLGWLLLLAWMASNRGPSADTLPPSCQGSGNLTLVLMLSLGLGAVMGTSFWTAQKSMEDLSFPWLPLLPVTTTSNEVVFTATFSGESPETPYWRDESVQYPQPSNAGHGEWLERGDVFPSGRKFFDMAFPIHIVAKPQEVQVLGPGVGDAFGFSPGRDEALAADSKTLDYTIRTDSVFSFPFALDGEKLGARIYQKGEEDKPYTVKHRSYPSFRRLHVGEELQSSDFVNGLPPKLHDVYTKIPGLAPDGSSVPAEMKQAYARVQELKKQGLKDDRLIQALLLDFQKNLAYHFDHQSMDPHKNGLDYFLFEDKKGVCRHFANALALMARMGGIPSRVVGGYAGGEFDKSTRTWTVRARNAHAWTEVWLGEKKGWVRVDPTAFVRVEKGVPPSPKQVGLWGSVTRFASAKLASFKTAGSAQMKEASGEDHSDGSAWVDAVKKGVQAASEWSAMAWPWVKPAALVLALGFLLSAFLTYQKTRQEIHANERAWRRLRARVLGLGYPILPSDGPHRISEMVAVDLEGEVLNRWRLVVNDYERWHFGGQAVDALPKRSRSLWKPLRHQVLAQRKKVKAMQRSKDPQCH